MKKWMLSANNPRNSLTRPPSKMSFLFRLLECQCWKGCTERLGWHMCGPYCNVMSNDRGLKHLAFATYINLVLTNNLAPHTSSMRCFWWLKKKKQRCSHDRLTGMGQPTAVAHADLSCHDVQDCAWTRHLSSAVLVIIKLTKNAVPLRFRSGSCKLKLCRYIPCFAIFKNVEHSLKPGETPSS